MKKMVVRELQKKRNTRETTVEERLQYKAPEIRGTTAKVSMSGAACPTNFHWQQITCKC